MLAENLSDMKGSNSQQNSPETNNSSSSSTGSTNSLPLVRQTSDPGPCTGSEVELTTNSTPHSIISSSYPPRVREGSNNRLVALSTKTEPHDPIVNSTLLMSHTETEVLTQTIPVSTASSPSYSELQELVHSRPLILQHPHHPHVTGVGSGEESTMSWLYDFYPSVLGASPNPKDKLNSFADDHQQIQQSSQQHSPTLTSHHGAAVTESAGKVALPQPHPTHTIFRSEEKYVVTLGAPISIAQRMGEDTLTYLNKGQFYSLYCSGNTNMSMPSRLKTTIYLTFFDEPDKRVELNNWHYWYNLQANPNQKAFDIDRKNCENVEGKPEDIGYNAASFVWCPDMGVKIVFRFNCLSTEFSSQKGVKGIPLHLVADTYEDLENESAEPVHRAYCKVKIFRDKGAERKNKDETKSVERRMQKFRKQQTGVSLDSEIGPASVFHPPSKETVLTSTSTFGPKPFLYIPQQSDGLGAAFLPPTKVAASTFLASIKERETKRTFSNTLKQAKETLDALEVEVENEDEAPPTKTPKIPSQRLTTIYVRKMNEKVYNALLLDSLTVYDFKLQVANKYDIHADMIKGIFKKTKKGLLVHFDDAMVARFQDEDDFVVDLVFDNQKGHFDLYVCY